LAEVAAFPTVDFQQRPDSLSPPSLAACRRQETRLPSLAPKPHAGSLRAADELKTRALPMQQRRTCRPHAMTYGILGCAGRRCCIAVQVLRRRRLRDPLQRDSVRRAAGQTPDCDIGRCQPRLDGVRDLPCRLGTLLYLQDILLYRTGSSLGVGGNRPCGSERGVALGCDGNRWR